MRVLIAVRLSNVTEATTSPARQRRRGELWTAGNGGEVVGYATDLDVSASKVDPFNRPELGKWLARPNDFDAVAWWRLDRAVRSMSDMAELGKWAKKHGKLLVFVEGPGGAPLVLDMRSTSPVAELIILLLAFAAQLEAEAIRERVRGSREHLRQIGRWHGGRLPYGWHAVANPDGPGWVLDEDPAAGPIVREIIRRVIAGESVYAVTNDLDRRQVPTASDLEKLRRTGTLPDPLKRWDSPTVTAMLRSEALRGYTMHDPQASEKRLSMATGGEWQPWEGRPVLDRNGHPRRDRPPLVDDETWAVLQDVMKTKVRAETRLRAAGSLLVRIAFCGGAGCGEPMYGGSKPGRRNGERTDNYVRIYRCKVRNSGHGISVDADKLDAWVEEQFLARFSTAPLLRQVVDPGSDQTANLKRVRESIARLRRDREAGLYEGADDEAEFDEMIRGLIAERRELEALPQRPATTRWVPTGRTYGDLWEHSDTEGRRRLLIDAGVRVTVSAGGRSGPKFDTSRFAFEIGVHDDPAAEALAAIAREEEEQD